MKKLDKVRIKKDAVGLLGLNDQHRKFAGMDAIILSIDGDTVTLAIDDDKDPSTPPIEITVKTKYIDVVSMLWQVWLLIRRMFGR
jgi:hypothetical protein